MAATNPFLQRALSWCGLPAFALLCAGFGIAMASDEGEKPAVRAYVAQAAAPERQTAEAARDKSTGCVGCHTASDHATMHVNPAVVLGCIDCHGGNARVARPAGTDVKDPAYQAALGDAHVLPRYPLAWKYPSSANPPSSYTLLNRESAEFIRFVNPGD